MDSYNNSVDELRRLLPTDQSSYWQDILHMTNGIEYCAVEITCDYATQMTCHSSIIFPSNNQEASQSWYITDLRDKFNQYEWYSFLCFLSSSFPPSITIPHLSHFTCLGGNVSLVVQDHIYEIRPRTNTTWDSLDHQDLSIDDTSFSGLPYPAQTQF